VPVERLTLEPEAGGPTVLARAIRALAQQPADVAYTVREIVGRVRAEGDAAVLELTRRFDSPRAKDRIGVAPEQAAKALRELGPEIREALELARENVRQVCVADPARSVALDLPQGQRVELREMPLRRAGAYVPGGRASYPSSVVMCCVPAKVAGVPEVVVATPPGEDGEADHVVLAACALCEVDEIYLMGGAQAIAALAFGTETVRAVDVIVGPGSHWVQEAKRQVVGAVGIDGVAGPTELAVIADDSADATLVALDLAAQSEHGADSLLALFSPSRMLLDAVESRLATLASERDSATQAPFALVGVPSVAAAVEVINALAPEHLELVCDDADRLADGVRAAGCVFIGAAAGAAFGDYAAGSNHVLPTGGAGRFAGPLDVTRFRRRQALVSLPGRAARALAPYVSSVARAEGFPLHAESAEARESLPE
jgi:histidinol dehydrogenase